MSRLSLLERIENMPRVLVFVNKKVWVAARKARHKMLESTDGAACGEADTEVWGEVRAVVKVE